MKKYTLDECKIGDIIRTSVCWVLLVRVGNTYKRDITKAWLRIHSQHKNAGSHNDILLTNKQMTSPVNGEYIGNISNLGSILEEAYQNGRFER